MNLSKSLFKFGKVNVVHDYYPMSLSLNSSRR